MGREPAGSDQQPRPDSPNSAICGRITLEGVRILNTGLRSDRDAISFTHVDDLTIQRCKIEGWNVSAIHLVGCHEVRIENCDFANREGFKPLCAIAAHAGSERIVIDECRFEDAGRRVLSIGGNSRVHQFNPPLKPDDQHASRAEAAHVTIQNCLFVRGLIPVAMINAFNVAARHNTIIRPGRCVLAVLSEQTDPRIMAGRSLVFGNNLVSWDAGDMQTLVELSPSIPEERLAFEENLWWSLPRQGGNNTSTAPVNASVSTEFARLGALPGSANWPQLSDVDPRLDEQFFPADERAQRFGRERPLIAAPTSQPEPSPAQPAAASASPTQN